MIRLRAFTGGLDVRGERKTKVNNDVIFGYINS